MSNYSNRVFNLLIISMILSMIGYKTLAQNIPNGDFEEWLTCLCDPPNWVTNNIYPPPLECRQVFMDYLTPYSGNYCVEGIVDTCPELALLRPPLIQSFNIALNSKPEALHGFYKYIPIGDDLFTAIIEIYSNSVLIGEGSLKSKQLVSDFSEFIVNIEYSSNDTPDVAIIKFTIDSSLVDNKLHQGSKWYIDYLFFGPLSDVDEEQTDIPNAFYLNQNYPNPFNPSTKIKFTIPSVGSSLMKFVQLKVFDVLGNEVATLVNEQKPAGTYEVEFNAASHSGNVRNLPSGIYFYQLKADSFIETKKMLLLK